METIELKTNTNNNFTIGHNFLEVIGEPSNEEWMKAFNELIKMQESIQWIIGDLLVAAKALGKDILKTFGDQVGYDHDSMYNMRKLAEKIPRDKRVTNVSWSHHRDAYVECGKNNDVAKFWLEMSKKNDWSMLIQRSHIREGLSNKNPNNSPSPSSQKSDVLYSEAISGLDAIKRFINHVDSKTPQDYIDDVATKFAAVALLIENI